MTQRRIYQCARPYHITFNILNHEGFFEDTERAKLLHRIILNASEIKNHTVYQFCIMPDHVHLLCRSNDKPISNKGIWGSESINQIISTEETEKNTAGTEAPQCFLRDSDFDDRADLRVCDGGDDLGFVVPANDVPKTMTNFMHSVKSFFVREMREMFEINYKFFQNRFNYRIVINDRQLHNVIHYIINNPIKADLPEKWNKHPYQYKNNDLIEKLFR